MWMEICYIFFLTWWAYMHAPKIETFDYCDMPRSLSWGCADKHARTHSILECQYQQVFEACEIEAATAQYILGRLHPTDFGVTSLGYQTTSKCCNLMSPTMESY